MNATKVSPLTIEKIDRKGITSFLLITFLLTYAIEGSLVLSGFNWDGVPAIFAQYVVMGVMWIPALAAALTIKFVTKEGFVAFIS
ncbi:MAG TPA: hypothetical protein VHO48_06125, partial [Anaerolineaceae bacterium]|nr:hypothetical protein [Anaerolineaceae bacterium]